MVVTNADRSLLLYMDFQSRQVYSYFFFSSRRRHTRFDCDWSSDVCSSDLIFYPTTGNFIGFVGNLRSRSLLRRALSTFRAQEKIPSEGAALPGFIPGVSWSDQWFFWKHGYPAIMVTDTALFRYPHYHLSTDTWDKLDYHRLALVVSGMEKVIFDLASD